MNEFYRITKANLMQLIDMGPVSTAIIADDNFQAYRSDVFNCNYTYDDSMVNHAV